MNDLKGWITGICLSLMLAGLAKLLAPGGSLGRLLQTLLALFVLCAVCVPLAGGIRLNLDLPEEGETAAQEIEHLRETLDEQTRRLAAEQIREQIEVVLAKYSIKSGEISIGMDRTEDGSIFISEILISIPKEQAALSGEIGRTIKTELGLDATIRPAE